jgi:hypothetical protein
MMLIRPDRHLERLTLQYRWEVTRRHPVYLLLWQTYQIMLTHSPPISWEQLRQSLDVINACNAIKMVSEPVDPSLSFEALRDEDASPLFFSNALQPVSVKTILGVVAGALSTPSLRRVADVFNALADGRDRIISVEEALVASRELLNSTDPEFSGLLSAPIYVISPVAPYEQLRADIAACQTHWRELLELKETRDRPRDHLNYLNAWDKCEGFFEGRYDRDLVRSLAQVGRELKKPESTIRRWYRKAFFLISGHEYSAENWRSLMGIQQVNGFFGLTVSPVSRKRLTARRIDSRRKEPNFSTVQLDADFLDTTQDDGNQADLDLICFRISEMMENGVTNSDIFDQIEIEFGSQKKIDESEVAHAIEYLRRRDDVRSGFLNRD